jgi:type IV pilus assembly protein PilM
MPAARVIAVECGTWHTACAAFTGGPGGRLTLRAFRLEPLRLDPGAQDDWLGGLVPAVDTLVRGMDRRGVARVALSGYHVLTKFIKTPAVAKAGRDKVVAFEAQQNIPFDLAEVVWDHGLIADDGVELEIILAAVKRDFAAAVSRTLVNAGLAPRLLEPGSVALSRCFRHNYPAAAGCHLVVAIGARSTTLLYEEGDRFCVRNITLAGNGVTQAIADKLGQGFAAAEQLKLAVLGGRVDLPADSPARLAVTEAVAAFVGRLHLEITRSTLNYRRQSGGAAPGRVLLTGGGSLLPDLPAVLAEKLLTPVEPLDPLREVEVADEAWRAQAPWLAELVGVALAPAGREIRPNLLPPALEAVNRWREQAPWWGGAAAALALGLLLPGWHYHRVAAAGQAKLREIEEAVLPLAAARSRNEDNLARLDQVAAEWRTLAALWEGRHNWTDFLADLQARLGAVDDVWLDRLEVLRPAAPVPSARPAGAAGLFGAAPVVAPVTEVSSPEPLRLNVTGRLLDRQNPVSRVSQESHERVKALLAGFVESRFIAVVENERFDATTPGVLRFDFVLVADPAGPL